VGVTVNCDESDEPVVVITHGGDTVQFKKGVYQAHATPVMAAVLLPLLPRCN
jgi:hypothetical protein